MKIFRQIRGLFASTLIRECVGTRFKWLELFWIGDKMVISLIMDEIQQMSSQLLPISAQQCKSNVTVVEMSIGTLLHWK